MRYLRLNSTDPTLNLAIEEALFASFDETSEPLFMLWQNGPSIIIGCHQNALQEINSHEVQARNLPVVRRSTGGGAVYHDLGNLNFSFLEYRKGVRQTDFRRYLEPIVRGLARCGVEAVIKGRNDLEVQGRKISGSAQRLSQGRVLHHGTLLVDADFEAMTRALTPDPEKYLSKGIASVRARVANISSFWRKGTTLDTLCEMLAEEAGGMPCELPVEVLARAQALQKERYGSWDWNIGKSPAFTSHTEKRFPFGRIQICLAVKGGFITACRLYGDFFAQRPVAEIEERLTGCQSTREAMEKALQDVKLAVYFSGAEGIGAKSGIAEDELRSFFLDAL